MFGMFCEVMTAYLQLCFQVTFAVTATFVFAVVKVGDPNYILNYLVGGTVDGSKAKLLVLILKVFVGDIDTSGPV
jgi:hypothetical protein